MELKLENVGRIKEASIAIDGITVICGDNNTGKSTVGKILYSIYSAFHNFENNVRREKINSMIRGLSSRYYVEGRVFEKAKQIFGEMVDAGNVSDSEIQEAINAIGKDSRKGLLQEEQGEIAERIRKYLAIQKDEIATVFLERMLASEFGGKLANVNTPEKQANVILTLKEGTISFHTSGKEQKVEIDQYFPLRKRLIYLDDPFILDEAGPRTVYYRSRRAGHREALLDLIMKSVEDHPENVIEEILREKELREIIEKMNEVSNGALRIENGELVYQHEGLKESLDLISVSTGVKTFAILRSLLGKGYIEENGIIVLDEPEVHLHPEWQIRLAEIIVLLQKAYGLNALITTHSNDFLSAIDYYSQKIV